MNTSPTRRLLVACSLTLAFIAGCGERAAENAGKQIDQATGKVSEKIDAAAGKVSEKIDEAAGKAAQKVDQVVSTVKQEATAAGREVGKVGAVASETITDTGITAQVKAAIITYPGLKSVSINVDTINGVVFLTGFVDSPADRQRSGEIAAAVAGVRSVDNNLRVGKPPTSRAAADGDGNARSY